jgi:glyoxylase-like metal-dependent hydrolase (beta-lactamase superfamily II)
MGIDDRQASMKWQVGDVAITKIVELEVTGGTRFLLPQATREEVQKIDWLVPHFADQDGRLTLSIHALVVVTPEKRIVVDTCLGNDKQGRRIPHWNERQGRFLEDMREAGFAPETIDTVLCTHLHVDHVGWNTRLVDGQWVPTFPNAQYLFGRVEYEHWSRQTTREDMITVLDDSIRPIFDNGLAELVEWDHRITPEVRLIPSTGHTPGHTSVVIESRGERAMITGDFAHHPCQFARPEWSTLADVDPAAGIETRKRLLGELAGEPVLVIGTHFSGPTAGHVIADGDAWRLVVEERNQPG